MKLTLNSILSGFLSVAKMSQNFTDIEDEFQDKVLYRDNPTGEPNQMENTLDMNSNKIINLPVPQTSSEAARLQDVINGVATTDTVLPVPTGHAGEYLGASGGSYVFQDTSNLDWVQDGTGATTRSVEGKLKDIVSVKDFGVTGDGVTDDTAAVQSAVTAQSGGTLYFPDGSYNITVAPTGIDLVQMLGSNKVLWPDVELPLYNSGTYTGGAEVAIVAGVIRYYAAGSGGAGWYFLNDEGDNHQPVLLGPITSSGSASITLDVNLNTLGLDENLWTPSGVVCGPDEDLAKEGMSFGASVTTVDIRIEGSINNISPNFIEYDGAAWDGTAAYTYAWLDGGTTSARLRLSRTGATNFKNTNFTSFAKIPVVTPKCNLVGNMTVQAVLNQIGEDDGSGNTFMDIAFFDAAGVRLQAESTLLKFYLFDQMKLPQKVLFNEFPDQFGNIWIVGVFTKKP